MNYVAKTFSAGPDIKHNPFAEALKDFNPGSSASVEPRKPRVSKKRKPSVAPVAPKQTTSSPKEVPLTQAQVPAQVSVAEIKTSPSTHPRATALDEPPRGNVSIGQLFLSHRNLLSLLKVFQGKKEKAICTFFEQGKRGGPDGKVIRSFLSLRIVVRYGEQGECIALSVIPGGTKWLAQRFPVGMEFFHDELLGHREAPEERAAATRALRAIIDDVRAARLEARKAKEGITKMVSQ